MSKTKGMAMWPPPVIPMRFSYVSRTELLDLPGYKEREEADRILGQLLLDILLIDDTRDMMKEEGLEGNSLPDTENEFTRGVRELWTDGRVSASTVFASQITLDIIDICGAQKNPKVHSKLLEAGERADQILGFSVDEAG